MPNRTDNVRITVTVDGKTICDVWEDRSGGHSDSTSVAYQRGGMGPRLALGGRQEVTNVVVKRIFDDEARAIIKTLRARAGRAPMTVSEYVVDDEGNILGDAEIWKGILKSASKADVKADGGAAAELDLEMTVSTTA
jgi:hypothetical protein